MKRYYEIKYVGRLATMPFKESYYHVGKNHLVFKVYRVKIIKIKEDNKMKLDKRLVDNVIRLTRKYYEKGDVYILPALNKAEKELVLKCKTTFVVVNLIEDLAKFSRHSDIVTYEDIYKALAVFGIIVEEKEKEND